MLEQMKEILKQNDVEYEVEDDKIEVCGYVVDNGTYRWLRLNEDALHFVTIKNDKIVLCFEDLDCDKTYYTVDTLTELETIIVELVRIQRRIEGVEKLLGSGAYSI